MTIYPASCASDDLIQRVAANLADVRQRITASGRALDEIRIVAVTKTFSTAEVRAARSVGLSAVGENYVDELAQKREQCEDLGLRWHYLGALQTNKIARVAQIADVLCGVSRAREIDRIATARAGTSIYVQVDFTRSAQRNGAPAREVASLVQRARDVGLYVRGLMTVAPVEPDRARQAFVATDRLCDDLGLVERSMGMTNDLEMACECGSSEVRVGRALFGPRDVPAAT